MVDNERMISAAYYNNLKYIKKILAGGFDARNLGAPHPSVTTKHKEYIAA